MPNSYKNIDLALFNEEYSAQSKCLYYVKLFQCKLQESDQIFKSESSWRPESQSHGQRVAVVWLNFECSTEPSTDEGQGLVPTKWSLGLL